MPSYLGSSIRISLLHADLRKTLTENSLRRLRQGVQVHLENIRDEFCKKGHPLQERAIEGGDGLSLNFLGQDQTMPFYLMKAGELLHQQSSLSQDVASSKHSSKRQSLETRALCLTVRLSSSSFLPQPSYTVPPPKKPIIQDVKVDVFYNGIRCACRYLSAQALSSDGSSQFLETYHGRRITDDMERPWIIVRIGENAEGGLRENKRSKYGNPNQRWADINSLLLLEAKVLGKDKDGNLTVLGEYLSSLASLELPQDMENVSGAEYGVIDVVLTSGLGKNDDASSDPLAKPQSARLSHLDWRLEAGEYKKGMTRKLAGPNITKSSELNNGRETFSGRHPRIVSPAFDLPIPDRAKRKFSPDLEEAVSPIQTGESSTNTLSSTKIPPMSDSPPVTKRLRTPSEPASATVPLPLRSTRSQNPTANPNGRQLEAAQEMVNPRKTKRNEADPASVETAGDSLHRANSELTTHQPEQNKVAVLKLPPSRLQALSSRATPSLEPLKSIESRGNEPGDTRATIQTQIPSRSPESQINENCVITYDSKGLRQVREERGFLFKESGVIFGVRYIVVPT